MALEQKIDSCSAKIGVIGMGYVGLPLAMMHAEKGFAVTGIDANPDKVRSLRQGTSYVSDIDSRELREAVSTGRLTATTDFSVLKALDVIFICVPTPFTATKDPDISYIMNASEAIRDHLREGQLIILKSTTFPETTENVVLPILESTGLTVGHDFYLAFSPERIDPGNTAFTVQNTPTVVGGITARCTELTCRLHRHIGLQVFPVSSPKVAEMEKLLENVFRSVNIALVNELACLCERMGDIDVWEVIAAASTKPFGFMPFHPGPGIGGHCINIDPYYLSWKAREYDFHSNFIELAAQTNENMPFHVCSLVLKALNRIGVPLPQARIFVLGVAFKKNVNDVRNSPALKIMEILMKSGLAPRRIIYNDPFIPEVRVAGHLFRSRRLSRQVLGDVDCVLIATDHSLYDYKMIVSQARLVVDTRNATGDLAHTRKNIVKLGQTYRRT